MGMKASFDDQLRMAQLQDGLIKELRFAPPRRWAFDWGWPRYMVAAEREGGTWNGQGRHVRGAGYKKDCVKYSEAAIRGWRVVRFTADMEKSGEALGLVQRAIDAAQKTQSLPKGELVQSLAEEHWRWGEAGAGLYKGAMWLWSFPFEGKGMGQNGTTMSWSWGECKLTVHWKTGVVLWTTSVRTKGKVVNVNEGETWSKIRKALAQWLASGTGK